MSENQKPTTAAYRNNWHTIWGTKVKHKTRERTLPRRRSAPALALQSPRHRQQVIPDKRRAANERAMNEETRAVALGLEPLGMAKHFTRGECATLLRGDIAALNTTQCKCGAPALPPHICPYQSDVNGDHKTKCNCCEQCEAVCKDEI